MIRMVLVLLLFMAVPLTGCFSQTKQQLKADKQAAEKEDPNNWDFGQINAGDVVAHDFIIKNESKKILNIKNTNTSCGCTVSEIKKKDLAPGESTALSVKLNSKGYSGWTQQFVYVNTDSVENPIIRFIIRADVIPEQLKNTK